MQREPETVDVFLAELAQARGVNARFDAFADDLERRLANPFALEPIARRIVEMMAFALQASLLVRYSSAAVADAFCSTRLDGDWGRAFGTMPQGLDTQTIVDRARIGGGSTPVRGQSGAGFYSLSDPALTSPALSISAPIFFNTLGAWPVVSGAGSVAFGMVAVGGRYGTPPWADHRSSQAATESMRRFEHN
jgi:hypothetical protein